MLLFVGMHEDRDTLNRINNLTSPRHLFAIPAWLDPLVLDRLLDTGYLTCTHHQRNESGVILLAMGLELTAKGKRLIEPEASWRDLAWKGSLAGASLTAMSVLILYLG